MNPKSRPRRRWDELYAALVAFQEEHDHCDVPRSHEDSGLYQFASKLRNAPSLTAPQIEQLGRIGFDFRSNQERREQVWEKKFGRLKAFKKLYKHSRVPQCSNSEELAVELGRWAVYQRQLEQSNKLSEIRKQKLLSIGFDISIKAHKNPRRSKQGKRSSLA